VVIAEGAADAPRPGQLFPWSFGSRAEWTAEQRRAQAMVLRRALAEEQAAIAELEKTLTALGIQGEAQASVLCAEPA
jgi:N-acetyl-anhydromuramyl-L-alanine amidase AmpD